MGWLVPSRAQPCLGNGQEWPGLPSRAPDRRRQLRSVLPGGEAPLRPAADGHWAALISARGVTMVDGSAPQSPARWTSLRGDGALAALLAVVLPVGTYFAAQHQPDVTVLQGQLQRLGHRPFDAVAVALVAASAGALAMRRRYPVAVVALVFGTTLVFFLLRYANRPILAALVIAYHTPTHPRPPPAPRPAAAGPVS